jgi:hypothetical protein
MKKSSVLREFAYLETTDGVHSFTIEALHISPGEPPACMFCSLGCAHKLSIECSASVSQPPCHIVAWQRGRLTKTRHLLCPQIVHFWSNEDGNQVSTRCLGMDSELGLTWREDADAVHQIECLEHHGFNGLALLKQFGPSGVHAMRQTT